jgi:surface-anchored protein
LTVILDSEHVHFEMNFDNGAWQKFDLRDDTHDVVYKPHQVLLYVGPEDLTTQQPGFDFVGAGQGNSFYETPLDTDESTPYTSVAVVSENIDPNTFDFYKPNDPRVDRSGEWMKLEMLKVDGPGYVSMWQDAQIPLGQWWMSSFDGGRTLDPAIYVEPGNHIHVHWGFTQPGIYHVKFQVSAFYGGVGLPLYSHPVDLTWGVEDTGMDTPGSIGLLSPVAATGIVGNPGQAASAGLASSLTSTPSPAALAVAAGNASTLNAFAADGTSPAASSGNPGLVQVPGTPSQGPGQLDAWFGDAFQNEATLVV